MRIKIISGVTNANIESQGLSSSALEAMIASRGQRGISAFSMQPPLGKPLPSWYLVHQQKGQSELTPSSTTCFNIYLLKEV